MSLAGSTSTEPEKDRFVHLSSLSLGRAHIGFGFKQRCHQGVLVLLTRIHGLYSIQVGMVGDSQVCCYSSKAETQCSDRFLKQIGKTSLMVKYVEGSFDEDYIQTLGSSLCVQ